MKSPLFIIIGISLLIISATVSLNYNHPEISTIEKECIMSMNGKVISQVENNQTSLLFVDQKGNKYIPVIESNRASLIVDNNIEICYSSIENTPSNKRIVHINRVVFLP